MFARGRRQDLRGAGEQRAQVERSEELDAEGGLPGGEEAMAQRLRLPASGSDDDCGTLELPARRVDVFEPARASTLPGRFWRGRDQ